MPTIDRARAATAPTAPTAPPSASAPAVLEVPRAADAYVARFDGPVGTERATNALVGDVAVRLPPSPTPRDASFVAEAGKPLLVVPPPRVFEGGTKSVALTWRLDDGRTATSPITDGTRDPRTGALVPLPAKIDVPADAAGKLRIRFEVEDKHGATRTQWDPSYDAVVMPQGGATIVFGDDFTHAVDGELRAAETLRIAYDADRLERIMGRADLGDARACVSFDGAPAIELPLLAEGGVAFLPGVKVPDDATTVEVWFKGQADGQVGWDSRDGKNFRFDVAMPPPDADPQWKRQVLLSAKTMMGGRPKFPGLVDETKFQALGPPDGGYNCIAWSLGVRSQWINPPATLDACDALYATKGYAPLPDVDLSLQAGVEKVALYAHRVGPSVSPTHGARQDDQGRWTSKLGNEPLIRHDDPRAVEGPSYGEIVRVYARPRPA